MEKEWQSHLNDDEIRQCFNWEIQNEKKEKFLEHISNCTYCADRFANFVPIEIEPPLYLEEEILEHVNQIHINFEKKVKQTSKKVQLFLYSLKVAFAISASIVMLFICVDSYHEIGIQGRYHNRYEKEMTQKEKKLQRDDVITDALNKFANDYLSPF